MNKLARLIIEIARGIRYEALSAFGTLMTIFLSMTFPGLFWVALINLNEIETQLKDDITIDVFLTDDIESGKIDDRIAELLKLDGAKAVKYLSKDDALFKMRESFGQGIIIDLDENPLPASFVISVEDKIFENGADSLISLISEMPETDEVIFAGDLLNRLSGIISTIQILGIAVALLVSFSAIFITGNIVRIAITDRRRTVELMQLVGATRSYILAPFVTLGGLLGLIGGCLAAFTVWIFSSYVSTNIVQIKFLPLWDVTAFILAGLLLGMAGALMATNRFLKI
jgi:cell division transport system permease protein